MNRALLTGALACAAAVFGAFAAARVPFAGGLDVGGRHGAATLAMATVDPADPLVAGMPVGRVAPARQEMPKTPYNGRFVFTRIQFDVGGGMGYFGRRGEPPWHHDHPSAEYNFAKILETVSYVAPSLEQSNILTLDDDRIFLYPILYMVEPGFWRPTQQEMENLREYLLKGGFIIFDDFDDNPRFNQMAILEDILRRVLPELYFVPLSPTDPIFDSFFEMDPRQLHFGPAGYRGDQIDFRGIYEDNDPEKRLLVIAGNRGDLGEFWEYSDVGFFPIDITNEAYKVGVNYIVYAMTH